MHPVDLEVVHQIAGQQQAPKSIHKNEAVTVYEIVITIRLCQYSLLHEAPYDEGYVETNCTYGEIFENAYFRISIHRLGRRNQRIWKIGRRG